jgi:ketosteroid isomerase-like protein
MPPPCITRPAVAGQKGEHCGGYDPRMGGAPQPITETDPDQRLLRQWAQAVNAREVERVCELSTPDIDLHPMQIAVAGHYHGHDGIRAWIGDILASGIGHDVRFLGIKTLPDGRVALFGEVRLEDTVVSPYTLVATMRDGKVAVTRSYLATEETLRLLKLLR